MIAPASQTVPSLQAPVAPAASPHGAPPPLPNRALEKPNPRAPLGRELVELLTAARKESASDVHIVSGRPAMFRVGGDLVTRGRPIDVETVERIVHGEVKGVARAQLDADGSCDLARAHPELGRFRVNVTRQRTGFKMCMRLVGREMPTLASLGLPEAIGDATHHHQGLIVVTGPDGPRQDDHAGGDRRHHQPRDDPPHHHRRGSGRVSSTRARRR